MVPEGRGREPRVHRRGADAGEVGERARRRLLGHGRLERAGAEPQPQKLLDVSLSLAHEVGSGDAAVDDAVLHVLGDVCCTHQQDVHGRIPAWEGERSLARLLGPEPGVLEQVDGGLAKAPFRR